MRDLVRREREKKAMAGRVWKLASIDLDRMHVTSYPMPFHAMDWTHTHTMYTLSLKVFRM